jgi:hypothetical protein
MALTIRRRSKPQPAPLAGERTGHTWAPVTGTIYTAPDGHVEDAWAASHAYGADYRLDVPSPSVLTAWVYPAHAGFEESDGYMVVTAFGHLFYGDDGEPYGCITQEASGDTIIYRRLASADRAARR